MSAASESTAHISKPCLSHFYDDKDGTCIQARLCIEGAQMEIVPSRYVHQTWQVETRGVQAILFYTYSPWRRSWISIQACYSVFLAASCGIPCAITVRATEAWFMPFSSSPILLAKTLSFHLNRSLSKTSTLSLACRVSRFSLKSTWTALSSFSNCFALANRPCRSLTDCSALNTEKDWDFVMQ